MMGLGTLINTGAILAGGVFGALLGSRLQQKYQDIMVSACGICTLFIGISGTLQNMFTVGSGGTLESYGTMMAIICFALGGVIGEFFSLEEKLDSFGEWLKKRSGSSEDAGFVNAFVTASLTVCIGAMAIVGSIQDGLTGDYSILAAKSVLDFIIVMALTASMGKGAAFSAVPVFLLQGSVTLLSRFIEPVMTAAAMRNLSLTGNMLIFCVGINLIWGKKIKVATLLPTIVLAVLWTFLPI